MQLPTQIRNKANELGLDWKKCEELGKYISDIMDSASEISSDTSKIFVEEEENPNYGKVREYVLFVKGKGYYKSMMNYSMGVNFVEDKKDAHKFTYSIDSFKYILFGRFGEENVEVQDA